MDTEARRRALAARKWLEDCAEARRDVLPQIANVPEYDNAVKALLVLVLTHETSDYLAEHDPQALKQAQQAINNKSWENYI